MMDRPAGDVAAERAIAALLCRVPEIWSAYDGNGLTELEEKALLQLTAAAMVQRRMSIRLRIIGHPVAVHATVTATGEHGMAEAMEAVAAGAWQHWQDTVKQRSENDPKPFHCEQVGADEWRLTAEGITAKADVENGNAEMVLNFVLRRGFFDGKPRVMPDGRVSQRLPIRGSGKAERLEFVTERQTEPVGPVVAVNNWAEGAKAIADALAPLIGPMMAQSPTAPHERASGCGRQPSAIERLITQAEAVVSLFDAMMGGQPDENVVTAASDIVFIDHPYRTIHSSGEPVLTFRDNMLPAEAWTEERRSLVARWASYCAMKNAICLAHSEGARGSDLAKRVFDTYCDWLASRERLLDPNLWRPLHAAVVVEAGLWAPQTDRVATLTEAVVSSIRRLSEPEGSTPMKRHAVNFRGTWEQLRAEQLIPAIEALRPYSWPPNAATPASEGPPTQTATVSPPSHHEPTGFMGVAALAKVFGVPKARMDGFKKRLERERMSLGDDAFHEVRDPRPNSPKYLYNASNPRIREIAAEYAK